VFERHREVLLAVGVDVLLDALQQIRYASRITGYVVVDGIVEADAIDFEL
jgi:hypothetical protein